MTDFFRSIDRALEPEPHDRWTDTEYFPAPLPTVGRAAAEEEYRRLHPATRTALGDGDPAVTVKWGNPFPMTEDSVKEWLPVIERISADLAERCSTPKPTGPTHWYDRIDSMGTE